MKPEDRLKTAASICGLWGGESIKRVRSIDGATRLRGRRVSVHLMAQELVATKMLGDRELQNQGLVSRFLTAYPPSTMGTRFFRDPSDQSKQELASYYRRLSSLLDAPLPLAPNTRNELAPRQIDVSPGARSLAIAFSDSVEKGLATDGALRAVSDVANKAAEQATRLAAVLQLYGDIEAALVRPEAMEFGVALMRYYLDEAVRLRDGARIPEHLRIAARLWDWIERKWAQPFIYLTPIYRKGPLRELRTKDAAERALKTLATHGYVLRVDGGALIDGAWRSEAWAIHGRRCA